MQWLSLHSMRLNLHYKKHLFDADSYSGVNFMLLLWGYVHELFDRNFVQVVSN